MQGRRASPSFGGSAACKYSHLSPFLHPRGVAKNKHGVCPFASKAALLVKPLVVFGFAANLDQVAAL